MSEGKAFQAKGTASTKALAGLIEIERTGKEEGGAGHAHPRRQEQERGLSL